MTKPTNAVPFSVVKKSTLPQFERSRYGAAIRAAMKNPKNAVVIDTALMGDKTNAKNAIYSLLSAIETRGLKATLKVSQRKNQLFVYRVK